MRTTSRIELDKSAVESNINFLREQFGKDVRISSVVKSNAYGHGFEQFVPILKDLGLDHFSVFSTDEALEVYKVTGAQADICVMGFVPDEDMEWVVRNGIEFYVFEIDRLLEAMAVAGKLKTKAKIHLEVETGMNRTGLQRNHLKQAVKYLKNHAGLFEIKGLCTHYAGAESIANYVRVHRQIRAFNSIVRSLRRQGIYPDYCHTACSAAAMIYPKTRMDMVRIGIMQYGFWPGKETLLDYLHKNNLRTDPLKRVITWKSDIMSIKDVREGEFVSYGMSYLAQENKRIAIIPVGYYHGYTRSLSNQGRVLINGQVAQVIGLVNMNMLIADITLIPGATIGDEVILIGSHGNVTISVASFGEFSDQLNYELLTRLPSNIERHVIN